MNASKASTGHAANIKRSFAAKRERVFRAWTRAEEMNRWSAPTDDYVVTCESDPRVGGKFAIHMKHSSGRVHIATGVYREVKAPERLVYTWQWNDEPDIETLVTVVFRDLGKSTEVELTHEGFPDSGVRDGHAEGWNGCLNRLAKIL